MTMNNIMLADVFREVSDVLAAKAGQQGRYKGLKDAYVAAPGLNLYGGGLFSPCGDNEVLSALVTDDAFASWLSWRRNNETRMIVKVFSWKGPEGAADQQPSEGYLTDKCAVGEGIEWGICEICYWKGEYERCGQDIAVTELDEKYCERYPVFRIDGSLVQNNAEWQASLAAQILKNDISQHLVIGNQATTFQFSGLENVVKTGWVDCRRNQVCTHVDSVVVDWGNASVSGIAALLQEVLGRLRLRARDMGGFSDNDAIVMLRSEMRDCLVNEFACESPCGVGSAGNPVTNIVLDSRQARDRYLVGGQNGDGYIPVAGHPISFLVNDWLPVESCPGGGGLSFVSDIYVLVRRVGNREVLYGVYHDMTEPVNIVNSYGGTMQSTDGGRFLIRSRFDEACFQTCVRIKPALICEAPWCQARIENVCCSMTELEPVTPEERDEYGIDNELLYQVAAWSGAVPM